MSCQRTLNIVTLFAALTLAGCGGDSRQEMPPAASYSVGFTVTGLIGSGLQLKNGPDTLPVAANGRSVFPTRLTSAGAYAVTVLSHPAAPAQTCQVEQGTGTIAQADASGVTVHCVISAAPRFAYAFNFGDDSISVYNVDAATGQLRTRGYMKVGPGARMPVQDAAGKFSFVLNSGFVEDPQTPLALSSISVFARDTVNGDLRPIEGGPFITSHSLVGASALTVHPSGKFVYVTTLDHAIFQWSVAPDGHLAAINEDLVECGASARQLVFDARGRFAYLTHAGHESDGIRVYEADAVTGALRERPGLRVQFANRDLRISNLVLHPAGQFAYVVNQEFAPNPGSVAAFAVDATTGALTPVPGQPQALPVEATGALEFDPRGRFAYALSFGTPTRRGAIAGFSIDASTGVLTSVSGSPSETDFGSGNFSLTPSGDFLFVANRASARAGDPPGPGSISAFKLDRGTGGLTRIAGIDALQPAPFTVSVDPGGRYLYAAGLTGDRIHAYRIDAAGALKPLAHGAVIRAGRKPSSIELFVSPAVATPAVFVAKSVYMADAPAREVTSFSVDAATGLLQRSGSIVSAALSPRALAPSADGRFLHSAELAGSATTFAIDSTTATLTEIDGGTIAAGSRPVAIAADASNRFVYVANNNDSTVAVYRRDRDSGQLSANGNPIPTVSAPTSMAIDPTGRNLYVMSFRQLQVFSIDKESGVLRAASTAEGGVTDLVAAVASQVAVEPGGKFLYVVDFSGSMEIYPIDPLDGALGRVSTTQIDPGSFSIAIDPTGRFLYSGGSLSRSVSVFSIAQEDGALTGLGTTMLLADPRQLLADSSGKYLWVLQFDNSIASFTIDQFTGLLTGIANQPQHAALATSLATVGIVQ
jgi:6-phosphogluconolactonase